VSEGGKFYDKYPACPKAKRDYWGVNIELDKRFSDNWMAGVSYTWSRLWGNYSGLASSDEWGRISPMVERNFDMWWLTYDKNLNEIVGPLNTDRPHQFKFWGSYVFPFGLTLGAVANAMSGIPVTRGLDQIYPDGRLTDGRTPFLFLASAYAEFNLKVTAKYRIQLNFNVDNIFDIKTARRVYTEMSQDVVWLSDDERLAGWSYDHATTTVTAPSTGRTVTYMADPRFLKELDFYPPLSARIGVKIIF